jgi:hypothetical protein
VIRHVVSFVLAISVSLAGGCQRKAANSASETAGSESAEAGATTPHEHAPGAPTQPERPAQSAPETSEAEAEQTYAIDATPVDDLAPPPEPAPVVSTQPIVIEKTRPAVTPEYFYLDEITTTYHAAGCPQITPAMTKAVKAAAMLRNFTPHTCVK